jgi:porphobilinogen synthase
VSAFPTARPRRLRRTPRCAGSSPTCACGRPTSCLPVFVKEGIAEPHPIGSMPGVVQHTRDSLKKAAHEARRRASAG